MTGFTDMLKSNETLLGFASTGITYAYIGSILVSLLCVFYGLVLWVQGKVAARVQRWGKRRPKRKGRGLGWRSNGLGWRRRR